jgi:hypothetical protein
LADRGERFVPVKRIAPAAAISFIEKNAGMQKAETGRKRRLVPLPGIGATKNKLH